MVENIRAGISRNSKPEFGGSFDVEIGNYAYAKTSNYLENSNTNVCTKVKAERGITLVALIITILFPYDEKLKCSNSKGFLLTTI